MTTNTQREFWVRKDPEQEWRTLKVSHPDYTDAVRIVANTFKEHTFGGGDQAALPGGPWAEE